ncbi:MFS transporter [Gemelliphila palaticanis]|uniref:MFS transporter n=1 Tax=Gemelliphila palaticanis TaxID=81950 RepID=A0ABX2T1V9_9BACL|nr:MFS transporter [Gemella palaticanis]MBF0715707.1 MFS transporter [Gemella palaticanis]NYS47637.1 MFS transporter [Gemella palaticanis]
MQNKLINKLAILSISIFLMSHLAIAPAIPKLFEIYNKSNINIGLASVETLVTIPAMMITIFVVLSNVIVSFLGKKKTVLLGLVLIALSGIIALISSNFTVVLISRLILGIGVGLYNSLSISIISDYYTGNERATMIGLRTAFLNIGKALTTFIAGYALIINPKYVFAVYLLVIPVFILFLLKVEEKQEVSKKLKSVVKFDKDVILLMIMTFFVGISYIGATIKIPTLLITKYNLATTTSSNLLSILALSGILSGFIFGKLIKHFSLKTMLFMITAMIFGNILFIVTKNIALLYVGAIFIGTSFVGVMSSVFFFISKYYEKQNINFVTSMALTAGNIGVILTPVILTKLPEKLGLELFKTPFYITSFIMIISVLIYIILTKNKNKVEN